MDKHNYAVFLMFFTTILTSSAQIFYKSGVEKVPFNLILMITNWQIILGVMLYVIGGVVMVTALKHGDVSTLYPIIATSYIWVSIGSSMFFNEIMNLWKWAGVFVIFFGVVLISYGSKSKESIAYTEGV